MNLKCSFIASKLREYYLEMLGQEIQVMEFEQARVRVRVSKHFFLIGTFRHS